MSLDQLFIEKDTISTSNEIISRATKTQTLNVIKTTLEDLLHSTTNKRNIDTILYDLSIIEDCFVIDMYKFQFKGMLDILQKDVKNIKEAVALEI